MKPRSLVVAWAGAVFFLAMATAGYAQYTATSSMTLAQNTAGKDAPLPKEAAKTEESAEAADENWDIFGPIRLRSADPEELGEIELKFVTEWGTSSGGEHDSVEIEPEIEYGIAPNHELIWAIPMELGFGGVDGNADQEVGWHWRLWKEDVNGLLPAFAIRNILRIPSGYHSSGVDWTVRGLFTKSIIPNKLRVHVNPYFALVNGNNLESEEEGEGWLNEYLGLGKGEEGHRFFRWGIIPGVDYKLTDSLSLLMAYVYENSPMEGQRDQHSVEIGLDWEINAHNEIGIVNRIGLDGDAVGDNYSIGITYAYVFDNVPHLGGAR